MLFNDTYKTIEQPVEGLFRDKGSKFIAFAYPIKRLEEVKELLNRLKALHPKANHHCWAARITPDEQLFKLGDDGEPAGTAGRPILNTLRAAGLTDILVVVVRYFGGTLLGVPGLINAYKMATLAALDVAEVVEKTVNDVYELMFDHTMMNNVMRIIKDEDLKVISQNYLEMNVLSVSIRKVAVNKVVDKLSALREVKVRYLYSE